MVENTQVSSDQGSRSHCSSTCLGSFMLVDLQRSQVKGWQGPAFCESRLICSLAPPLAYFLDPQAISLGSPEACPLEMDFFAKILLIFQHHMSAYSQSDAQIKCSFLPSKRSDFA